MTDTLQTRLLRHALFLESDGNNLTQLPTAALLREAADALREAETALHDIRVISNTLIYGDGTANPVAPVTGRTFIDICDPALAKLGGAA